MKTTRLLLIFPALVVFYIAIRHPFYFILYPYSVIDPYIYYSYSPGFWAVDIAFWVFSPLMYLKFRKNGDGRFISLLYMFCLDASSVGIFLVFFCLVYGINIFSSEYYTYAFVLTFLFIVPISHLRIRRNLIPYLLIFPIAGLTWRLLTPGNVGYSLSFSVVIDMAMIVYCFFWNAELVDAIPKGGDMEWIKKSLPS